MLAVPIGACEQHGPHLPLDTDTRIAVALAESLSERYGPGEVMVAPPVTITASGEHAAFPGTLSIGTTVMEQYVIELVRSADWSAGVVLVNGHGGNKAPVSNAARLLRTEHRRVLPWWPHVADGDAHAGDTETSLMLALAPQFVRMDALEVGNTEPMSVLADTLRTQGVRAVSENGILGDPRHASASRGRALFTALSIDLFAAVDEWWE